MNARGRLSLPAFASLLLLGSLLGQKIPANQCSSGEQQEQSLEVVRELGQFQITNDQMKQTEESEELSDLVNLFPVQSRQLFHGSVYEYHRNDNLDARNFFDPVGRPLPEYKRNQFGFSLGSTLGPRLHLHGAYDGLRSVRGSTILSNVPTASMKSGDFSQLLSGDYRVNLVDPLTGNLFENNRIPAGRLHPAALRLLPLLPDPNRSDESLNFVNNDPDIHDGDYYTSRVNIVQSEQTHYSVQFSRVTAHKVEAHSLPAFGRGRSISDMGASLAVHHSFSSRAQATLRIAFDREVKTTAPQTERPAGLVNTLGISGIQAVDEKSEGYPDFDLSGYESFGDSGSPEGGVSNRYRAELDVEYIAGRHALHFEGGFFSREINDHRTTGQHRGAFKFSGRYTGDGFADFLLGMPESAARTIGTSRLDLRAGGFNLFLEDDWRVSPRFTVSTGIGYSFTAPFRSTSDNVSVFYPLLFEPPPGGEWIEAGSARAADLGLKDAGAGGMVIPDRNNWAPSLAVAFRPFVNGSQVIRASYSIFYEPLESGNYLRYLGRNYPFFYTERAQSGLGGDRILDLSRPFTSSSPAELNVRGITPNAKSSYFQVWNLEVQNSLGEDWVLRTGYQGRRGLRLKRELPGNVPLPGADSIQARRPDPGFGMFYILTDGGSSLAHELEVSLDRRFAQGMALRFELDWSREFDDDFDGKPSNPRDLHSEWAPKDDNPFRFSVHYILQLPIGRGRWLGSPSPAWLRELAEGWQLSGITTFRSGDRFTVGLPGDFNNDGLDSDRPQLVGNARLSSSERTPDRWFDPTAFQNPAPYGFGSAGRNILVGPPFSSWEVSLVKDTTIADTHRLQLRIALFNAFNHANFQPPERTYGTPLFGRLTSAGRAREIEVALKYLF